VEKYNEIYRDALILFYLKLNINNIIDIN